MTTTAQWIAAWGTVGGAIATLVAVVLAYLGLRGELRRANEQRSIDAAQREQDRHERRDREAAQARLVLVTVDALPPPRPDSPVITGTHRRGEVRVLLHNQSQQPVLDAHVDHVVLRMRTSTTRPPYTEIAEPPQRWELDPEHQPATGPIAGADGRRWQIVILRPDLETGTEGRRVVGDNDEYEATVVFTDAAGLRWRRTGLAQPQPVLEPGPRAT